MIQQTSLLAYTDLCRSKYVHRKLQEYLSTLATFTSGASDREVAERLNWDPGRVSARRNDAIEQDMVIEFGRKKDEKTGKTVIVWGLKV